MNVESFSISEIGLGRNNNEDLCLEIPEASFFALADGMGGHRAGEVAAKEAMSMLSLKIGEIASPKKCDPKNLLEELKEAIHQANSHVYRLSKENPNFSGMGTTLSCFLIHDGAIHFGHIGDSRLYLFRNELKQLTQDHSLRSELLRKGELTTEQARAFPYKNVLTRALGTTPQVAADTGTFPALPGDLFLLCSDGLTDQLNDEEISKTLSRYSSIADAAKQLVQEALNRGGRDNITLLLVKIVS